MRRLRTAGMLLLFIIFAAIEAFRNISDPFNFGVECFMMGLVTGEILKLITLAIRSWRQPAVDLVD